MKITIKEVAKKADVSIATVSRVLNNANNVSEDIKKRVEKVIEELNYQPNSNARALKNSETKTIGIIVPDLSISFFSRIIKIVENKAKEYGYMLLVVSTDDNSKDEREYLQIMAEKRVSGIIIATAGGNDEYMQKIQQAGIPIVIIDRRPQIKEFDNVYMDKVNAIYDITNHLIEKGHERIVLISGKRELSTNYDRFMGFVKAYYDKGKSFDQTSCYFGEYSKEHGVKAFKEILSKDEKPTAIISGSEIITHGILLEAQKRNIEFPNDFSLISFGTFSGSELLPIQITYIDDMKEEIGEFAGELLLDRLIGERKENIEHVLSSHIVHGNTVKSM